jgi:hypothetical protein
MSNGIPIRLSEGLASRAREAASILDRSLTEQVEHWARLGQLVEAAVSSTTVEQLKRRSYDERLPALLAVADTPDGKAKAVALIRERNAHRAGATPDGTIYQLDRRGKRVKSSRSR